MSYRLYAGRRTGPNLDDLAAYRYVLFDIIDDIIEFNMRFQDPKINNVRMKSQLPRPIEDFEHRYRNVYDFVGEFNNPEDAIQYIVENNFELFL